MGTGDISLIDSFEYDPGRAWDPTIIHISGDVYAIAYAGVDGAPWGTAGWLATVTIGADGTIGAIIDTLKFDADDARGPDIIHVSGDVYAIVYQHIEDGAPFNGINLITVTIDSEGDIGDAITDRLILDSYYFGSGVPRIIHIFGTVYAAVYSGTDRDGYVKTFTIAADGDIGAVIDFLEYETERSVDHKIIHVSGNVYAIAFFQGDASPYPLRVVTVTIETNGQVGDAIEDTADLSDHIISGSPDIINLAGSVFAVVYGRGPAGYSWVLTFTIAPDGTIGAMIDNYAFDESFAHYPFIIRIVGEVYAIAYSPSSTDKGIIKTLTLHSDGQIDAAPVIDTVEFEATFSHQPRVLYMAGNTYALVYRGPDEHGFLVTLDIETSVAPTVTTDPATGRGAIAATVNGILNQDGGEACECGFEWGLDTGYGTTTPPQSKTTGETFSQVIGGLFPNTTYHFRAFATNSLGTSHGADRSFATALVISRAFALGREEL